MFPGGVWHLVEALWQIKNASQGILPLLHYTILYYWDGVCDIVDIVIQLSIINHKPPFAPWLGDNKGPGGPQGIPFGLFYHPPF